MNSGSRVAASTASNMFQVEDDDKPGIAGDGVFRRDSPGDTGGGDTKNEDLFLLDFSGENTSLKPPTSSSRDGIVGIGVMGRCFVEIV